MLMCELEVQPGVDVIVTTAAKTVRRESTHPHCPYREIDALYQEVEGMAVYIG